MKHNLKITIILVAMFIFAQIIGLFIISNYLDFEQTRQKGEAVFIEPPYGERPEIEDQTYSFIHISIAIIIGTLIVFLFIKLKWFGFWKVWYWFAILACLTYAFGAFIPKEYRLFPAILALIFATFKVLRPGLIVNNIVELFIYGGLASIFVPEFINFFSATILLIVISLYDMYAVWKSKHMVKLANFQTDSKIFAGLSIPYKMPKLNFKRSQSSKTKKVKTAILGGGDIGFPLLFSGTVLKSLAISYSAITAFSLTLIITFFTALSLLGLLLLSKKNKFYPAMPFISVGCFVGYLMLMIVRSFI